MERCTGEFQFHNCGLISAFQFAAPILNGGDCALGDFSSNQSTLDADLPCGRWLVRDLSVACAPADVAASCCK